ncbi:YlxR family protein [Bogoriella caseilytica]|nr:YlxR family protein [Bogoriella caseilytica]
MTSEQSGRHQPIRTCVGCREPSTRSVLVRVVLESAAVAVVDEAKRAPGRGAWLHPSQACLDLALRRRALGRALRTTGPLSMEAVEEWFARSLSAGAQKRDESGLEADGHPMSTQR